MGTQIIVALLLTNCLGNMVLNRGHISRYTSFQQGVICTSAMEPVKPVQLNELQDIVVTALKHNYTVKPLGNLYSATDIICTDGIPVSMQKINHFRYDKRNGIVTVGAGASLGSLNSRLHELGRAVYGVPTYEDVTIGGAIGTGAHGTNFRNPATLSDILVGVVVVDGLGNVRNITDPETLRAFRVHLGLLGIIYEVSLTTIPQYKINIRNYPQPDDILWKGNEIMRLAKSTERLQFFWFPNSRRVILSVGNRVALTTPGNCETHFIPDLPIEMSFSLADAVEQMQESMNHLGYFLSERLLERSLHGRVVGRSPLFSEDGVTLCRPAVGYSHRMLANKCKSCPWQYGNSSLFPFENSVVIPLTELYGAIQSIRKILQIHPMQFILTGIIFRFLTPSNGLLALNSDRASVAVEWVLIPRRDRFNKPMFGLPSSQAIMQALIEKHQGRVHWGKGGPLNTHKAILQEKYPHLSTFVKHMDHFDPKGIFLNDFGRRLKYGYKKTSLDTYAKHCGLIDSCICQHDRDCGNEGPGSYVCRTILNYPVCKEREGEYATFRSRITNRFLSMF